MAEPAVDQGGPKREFWRLLGYEIKAKMCTGDSDCLSLDHDIIGLQVCFAFRMNQLLKLANWLQLHVGWILFILIDPMLVYNFVPYYVYVYNPSVIVKLPK